MAETVRDATQRSELLIDSLLVLARSDSASLVAEPIDLAALARGAAARLSLEPETSALDIELALEPAIVIGDRSLLDRLVGNLVENAARHNINGGWITIETGQTGDVASLRIANPGAVLGVTDVDALFDRFHRADEARARGASGFGLGLSIVAAVARAHHGRVRAEALPDGGLTVTVEFPAAPRTHTSAGTGFPGAGRVPV